MPLEEFERIVGKAQVDIATKPFGATPKFDVWRSILAGILGPMGNRRFPMLEVFALEYSVEEELIKRGACQRGPLGGLVPTKGKGAS